MTKLDMIILYVKNVEKSAQYYQEILGAQPLDVSEHFAMMALEGDVKLGLWTQDQAVPVATATAGSIEIVIEVETAQELEALANDWSKKGANQIQDITDMPFGKTFTVADPDGHRIRPFVPAMR